MGISMSEKGRGWRPEELCEGKATWNASVSWYHEATGSDIKLVYFTFKVIRLWFPLKIPFSMPHI